MPRKRDEADEENEEGSGDDDNEGEEEGQEAQQHGGPQGENDPTPQPQPQPQTQHPYFEMGGSSSIPQMPFDANFLQSFSNLQVEVAKLREGLQ